MIDLEMFDICCFRLDGEFSCEAPAASWWVLWQNPDIDGRDEKWVLGYCAGHAPGVEDHFSANWNRKQISADELDVLRIMLD